MYCVNCAAELSQGRATCWSCGAQQPTAKPAHASLSYTNSRRRPDHPYRNIGGALQFINVCMYVAGACSLVFGLLNVFGGIGIHWLTWTAVLLIVLPLGQLFKRSPKFLGNWHVVWLIDLCSVVIRLAILLFTALGPESVELAADYTASSLTVARALIFAYAALVFVGVNVFFFLLRIYFTRSVRVRTYMGTDAYITKCLFTENVVSPQPAVPDTAFHEAC